MFKTGYIKIKTQVLQTIFAELPQTAKKVKLTIKFDDEEKLNTFKRLEAKRKQDQEDCVSIDSSHESGQEQDSIVDLKVKNEDSRDKSMIKKQVGEKLKYQKIEINLQEGIIYKQFYEKQFDKIGQANKVKIKIRAQKITFEGFEVEEIEEAMDQVRELRKHIDVEYIPNYGLEMSESQMIRKKLQKLGVKIFRILDKYYRWYEVSSKLQPDEQRRRRVQIKDLFRQIDSNHHNLQYLHSIQKQVDVFRGSRSDEFLKSRQSYMKYRPLLQDLKVIIFEKEIKHKINSESNDDEIDVELSLSKNALVFHSNVKQIMEMSIKATKQHFRAYDFFYFTVESDCPIQETIQILKSYEYDSAMDSSRCNSIIGQIQEVKEINYIHFATNYETAKKRIQDKMNDPNFYGDYIPKQNVIFCIGFRRKYPEKRLEYLCEMLEKLHKIWAGAAYKISIMMQQGEDIQVDNVSYEFNQNEKVFSLSANETTLYTYLLILRDYVIGKKMQIKKQNQLTLDQDNNITITTINASQIIEDSSYLHEKSMSQDLSTSSILEGIKNNQENILNEILKNPNFQQNCQDQKCIKILKEYKVFLNETNKEYNEKYKDQDVKENTIVQTDKRNRPQQDQLTKIADSKFQVFKVKINPKHKIESFYENPERDQLVTIFVSNKNSPFIRPEGVGLKIDKGMYEHFPIRLLGIVNQSLTQNGYLINIKKRNIEIHGKSFRVKYGIEFEVAKEIVHLKK